MIMIGKKAAFLKAVFFVYSDLICLTRGIPYWYSGI